MEAKNNIERLEQMIGNPYLYRARSVTIRGYVVNGDEVQIRTQDRPISTTLAKLGDTLDELLPVQEELSDENKNLAVSVYKQERSQMRRLEETLMSQIEKIDKDPKYIDQAKEINNTAKNLIRLNGQKVKMLHEIRKTKEG